jgi:hypothetical protein
MCGFYGKNIENDLVVGRGEKRQKSQLNLPYSGGLKDKLM